MAIQIRRGNKSDLGTLETGEPAFAIDTKEVFIGGSSKVQLETLTNGKLTHMPSASDVHARADNWLPTAAQISAQPQTAARNTVVKANATGDLITATAGVDYPDTPRPNLLINPDFRVHQRGDTFTGFYNSGKGIYTADRWMLFCASAYSANLTAACQDAGGLKIKNAGTSSSYCYLRYYVEYADVSALLGCKVVVSYNITNSSGTTTTYELKTIPDAINADASYQLINKYITIPASSTTTINWVKVEIADAATASTSSNFATPYTPRPFSEELADCRRYYRTDALSGFAYDDLLKFALPMDMRIYPPTKVTPIYICAWRDAVGWDAFTDPNCRIVSVGRYEIDVHDGQTGTGFAMTKVQIDAEIYP